MKKLFTTVLVAGSVLSSPLLAEQTHAMEEPIITVKLSNYLGNQTQISVKLEGEHTFENYSSNLSPNVTYTIKLQSGVLSLYNGSTIIGTIDSSFKIVPKDISSSQDKIYINGRPYLGSMRFLVESSYVRPENSILLEDYVKGVVPSEMSNSWGNYGGLEALKAQAVAARTYGWGYIGKSITDTQSYQVYGGYNSYSNTKNAVENTRGEILKYNDKAISAFFSSSNGGRVFSNTNSWGSSLVPYLHMKDDVYDARSSSPYTNWSFSIKKQQIDMNGKDLMNPSAWWGTSSEADNTLMNNIKSWLISHGVVGSNYDIKIVSIPKVTFDTSYTDNQEVDGQIDIQYYLKDKNGSYVMENGVIKPYSYSIVKRAYDIRSIVGSTIMRSPYIKTVDDNGTSFVVTGGGWGHNIGMSQYGAYQRSKEGIDYKSILNFYYENAVIDDDVDPSIIINSINQSSDKNLNFNFDVNEDSNVTVKLVNQSTNDKVTIYNKSQNNGNVSFTYDASQLVGDYKAEITATDSYGNSGMLVSKQNITLKDTTPPIISVQSINQDDSKQLNFNFSISEDSKVLVDLVNKDTNQSTNIFNQDKPQGQVNFSYDASDLVGNFDVKITAIDGNNNNTVSNPISITLVNLYKGETYNEVLNLYKRTTLYGKPDEQSITYGTVSPQQVQAIERYNNNWFLIKTYLGPLWIKPENFIPGKVESINRTLILQNNTDLYTIPFDGYTVGAHLSPQSVVATQKVGNFYNVKTRMGNLWLKYTEPVPEDFVADVVLKDRTTVYTNFYEDSSTQGTFSPQTVKAVKRLGDNWFLVNSYLGLRWVHPTNFSIPLNTKITTDTRKDLYSSPNVYAKTGATISPQTVTVKEEINGKFYRIATWLGDRFISK